MYVTYNLIQFLKIFIIKDLEKLKGKENFFNSVK